MRYTYLFAAIAIMAAVTYATRVVPLVFVRKKLTNRYVRSFLTYLPCGVLAAMVFPDILYSTSSMLSGILGTLAAIFLAYRKKGLLIVAIGAVATVFLTELVQRLI